MASNISGQNLVKRNAILFAVVSREHGASQSFISRRLGNNIYSSKKAIVRRIHKIKLVKIFGVGCHYSIN
jgi:hypothetical protein